jgi:hypothetical protein
MRAATAAMRRRLMLEFIGVFLVEVEKAGTD